MCGLRTHGLFPPLDKCNGPASRNTLPNSLESRALTFIRYETTQGPSRPIPTKRVKTDPGSLTRA
ncbi:hypothetical protein A176_001544 [Myxococcus hansupus]|uniref:Uncharacterized protein n=1 Tax=Pseudomyxococcus hansupus TaxID=1297742 RepID=A0A0H4X9S7_9BACT|nr:hypothetical protein A176_001544 [Myxococcus hansupus]